MGEANGGGGGGFGYGGAPAGLGPDFLDRSSDGGASSPASGRSGGAFSGGGGRGGGHLGGRGAGREETARSGGGGGDGSPSSGSEIFIGGTHAARRAARCELSLKPSSARSPESMQPRDSPARSFALPPAVRKPPSH